MEEESVVIRKSELEEGSTGAEGLWHRAKCVLPQSLELFVLERGVAARKKSQWVTKHPFSPSSIAKEGVKFGSAEISERREVSRGGLASPPLVFTLRSHFALL